jgi:hypothetical protein
LVYVWKNFFAPFILMSGNQPPPKYFSTSPPLANIFGRNRGKKNISAGHHRLSQGNSSRHPPRAIPFNVHTPLWTRSINLNPLEKKDQSADTNTPPPEIKKFLPYPSEKCKDQRMPMHTQKRLFQTPAEILVHRGVCTLNGMAPIKRG